MEVAELVAGAIRVVGVVMPMPVRLDGKHQVYAW